MSTSGFVLNLRLVYNAESKWGWNPKKSGIPSGHILITVPGMLAKQWEEEAHRFLDKKYWNVLMYPTVRKTAPEFWTHWNANVENNSVREQTTILIVSHTASSTLSSANVH